MSPLDSCTMKLWGIACSRAEECRFLWTADSRTYSILMLLCWMVDIWLSVCTEAPSAGLLSAFFPPGFLLALTQGREQQAQNSFSRFTLMKLRYSSALGGASLGARHIGYHLPMDYSVNATAFYSYTF